MRKIFYQGETLVEIHNESADRLPEGAIGSTWKLMAVEDEILFLYL